MRLVPEFRYKLIIWPDGASQNGPISEAPLDGGAEFRNLTINQISERLIQLYANRNNHTEFRVQVDGGERDGWHVLAGTSWRTLFRAENNGSKQSAGPTDLVAFLLLGEDRISVAALPHSIGYSRELTMLLLETARRIVTDEYVEQRVIDIRTHIERSAHIRNDICRISLKIENMDWGVSITDGNGYRITSKLTDHGERQLQSMLSEEYR